MLRILPIEVNSGKESTLKYFQRFWDLAPNQLAIRVYAGPLKYYKRSNLKKEAISNTQSHLFPDSKIEQYIVWFKKSKKQV